MKIRCARGSVKVIDTFEVNGELIHPSWVKHLRYSNYPTLSYDEVIEVELFDEETTDGKKDKSQRNCVRQTSN